MRELKDWADCGITNEATKVVVRRAVGVIPCELCKLKGGSNIEDDGGCRHRPTLDGMCDVEVFNRLRRP